MASVQDSSIGIAVESTFKTFVAPTRFYEFTDESLNWNKQTKQGAGIRVGSRVARAARRVVVGGDGGGDFTVEVLSKGMGLLWQACLGAGTSTLVSGTTYQQNFTVGDAPSSLTIQKGLVQAGGTVDAYSYVGCAVDSWEFDFSNLDLLTLKVTVDAADYSVAQTYATPSYPVSPNLFSFQSATLYTGTFTAPTTTTLASATTSTSNVRSGSVSVNNNIRDDRYNIGGGGRKAKQIAGMREITGSLDIEYDSTVYRDLYLNDQSASIVLQYTAGALSTGTETLQVVLPNVRFDGDLPQANGTDLVVQSMKFTAYDDLANQPIYVVHRTSDAAL